MGKRTLREYFISYGPIQHVVGTLKEARETARTVAKQTIYAIDIIHDGDVLETWKPRISRSGRVTFRRVRNG